MIDFMSAWAEQIVLAIVVATIIELILPENKNKKYIQMVIGVYILFNIISPIMKNKEQLSIDNYYTENYTTNSEYVVDQTSMDKRIERIYIEELEKNVKSKFEENGYTVSKCEVNAVLDTSKKNAGIHSITVKIKDEIDNLDAIKIKEEIATEFEIDKDKIIIK